MKELIFASKDNYKIVSEQLRFAWLKNILFQIGINLDNCFPESDDPNDQTIEQKINLKKILSDNNMCIEDNNDDSLFIYVQNQLIAWWKTPLYDKREDHAERDKQKRFYIGINIEYSSCFEEVERE